MLWEFSRGQQLLSLGRDQSLSLAWICPAVSQIQLFGILFLLEQAKDVNPAIKISIRFKDVNVNETRKTHSFWTFSVDSAPLALAFV